MKQVFAFSKKEWMEGIRSTKVVFLILLFTVFGIMNPAMAKLTPWLMEMMAESLEKTGMVVTGVTVNALTSWTQFFKNVPMGLLAFVLLYSSSFTREYQQGTLLLILTKGLPRYKVIFSKFVVMLLIWTFFYWLCFAVTYGYTVYFWDNSIALNLPLAAACWWLFGVWVICLLVLFSALFQSNAKVLLAAGITIAVCYFSGIFPVLHAYMPTTLMDSVNLLTAAKEPDFYTRAATVTLVLSVLCVAVSIPVMNKKEIL